MALEVLIVDSVLGEIGAMFAPSVGFFLKVFQRNVFQLTDTIGVQKLLRNSVAHGNVHSVVRLVLFGDR